MTDRVQKMARINVDPDAWAELRVRALRNNASLADVLGALIERDVGSTEATAQERAPNRSAREPGHVGAAATAAHSRGGGSPTSEVEDWDSWVPPWEE